MYSENDRVCPISGQTISSDVCYEVVMCLTGLFKPSSVPEMDFKDDEKMRAICNACPYSDLS